MIYLFFYLIKCIVRTSRLKNTFEFDSIFLSLAQSIVFFLYLSLVSDCVIIIILCCYACAVGITWHTADCLQGSGTITVGCQKHNFAIIFYRIHIFTVLLLRRHSQPLYSIILFFQELIIILPLSTFRFLEYLNTNKIAFH